MAWIQPRVSQSATYRRQIFPSRGYDYRTILFNINIFRLFIDCGFYFGDNSDKLYAAVASLLNIVVIATANLVALIFFLLNFGESR